MKAVNLHWLGDRAEIDFCAHGTVHVSVEDQRFVSEPDPAETQCVSAAALFLLRTLESSHNATDRVGEHLVPHCGHSMYAVNRQGQPVGPDAAGEQLAEDVMITGCPHGYDWHVDHDADGANIRLTFDTGATFSVTVEEWTRAVCKFSDQIEEFHDAAGPKQIPDEISRAGYKMFRHEWRRRRDAAGV